eukprot:GDKJ01012507.1.p1 GENE.GDKJ01012507.1~~GDKJ01012507.1.p1  ORF type:complete len:271 (-),score=49.62 GDKJ01012507.1:173-985(-)
MIENSNFSRGSIPAEYTEPLMAFNSKMTQVSPSTLKDEEASISLARFPKVVPTWTDPVIPILSFSSDHELIELHARLSSRSFHSRTAQLLVAIQDTIVSCCPWLRIECFLKDGSVGRSTSVVGCSDCDLIIVVPSLPLESVAQWRPTLTKMIYHSFFNFISSTNNQNTSASSSGVPSKRTPPPSQHWGGSASGPSRTDVLKMVTTPPTFRSLSHLDQPLLFEDGIVHSPDQTTDRRNEICQQQQQQQEKSQQAQCSNDRATKNDRASLCP